MVTSHVYADGNDSPADFRELFRWMAEHMPALRIFLRKSFE